MSHADDNAGQRIDKELKRQIDGLGKINIDFFSIKTKERIEACAHK